ncbi:hypothetical protein PR202_gb20101 [Eleusine coracana subsp. coracana]|uniref:F-box domain-containing protein n=1 Tax=Eleusine coracana subsp. coracana TaxID=191504 RepID=A0AAV5F9U7_ELECO|nr:hypothetical protein PR202_gb20101 [Eleusine coracana subsp. coracana]
MAAAGNGRREAALGALAVLPDEVLCAVVDLLPPADIGRLACASRLGLCSENNDIWQKPHQFDGFNSLYLLPTIPSMASAAKFPQNPYSDMSLRDVIDLLTARLEAKEVANRTAVLAQPVMVVPVAEENKPECSAELVQTVVQVPKAPISSTSLFLAVPTVPLLRKKTQKKKKKATAAPLLPSIHLRPMACLKHCGIRRKCKDSRVHGTLFFAVEKGNYGKDMEHHPAGTVNRWNHSDLSRKEKRLKASETPRTSNSENQYSAFELSGVQESLENEVFSYDIDFLSQFLEKERDHYSSVWSPTNSIDQREAREWLRRLWVLKPELRELIWKGACLAISVDKWYSCLEEICACHSLPLPTEDESFLLAQVFIVSGNVIKIYAEGGLGYSVHGLGTELEFYHLLQKIGSPLISHIPEIIASGFLEYKDDNYRTVPWDGKGIPDVLAKHYPLEEMTGEVGDAATVPPEWKELVFTLNGRKKNVKKHLANCEKADGDLEQMNAIHIIDFSDLSIGDPLCDIIPLHLDVFRGDNDLLREFLLSYQLPFLRGESNTDICKSLQNSKFSRASYRAMCFCMLHEDNVLAAIFSLWKELRDATCWEDVEHFVWEELNRDQSAAAFWELLAVVPTRFTGFFINPKRGDVMQCNATYGHSALAGSSLLRTLTGKAPFILSVTESTSGCEEDTSQKNQVSADDVVSRPAMRKLSTTSRSVSSLLCSLSLLVARNLDRTSSLFLCSIFDAFSFWRRRAARMMSMAKACTSAMAVREAAR